MASPDQHCEPAAFIPAKLDDAQLSAAQFRVFCRIARRRECVESVPNIAEGCRLEEKTVWSALRLLIDRKMVAKIIRPGQSSVYSVNPSEQWTPNPNGTAPQTARRVAESSGGRPNRHGDNPTQTARHKGNPSEGNPFKVEAPILFEPIKQGLYRREYDAMIADAQKAIQRIKADPKNYVKDLTTAAEELITFLTTEKPENWQARVEEVYSNAGSYERKNPKPKTAAILKAWSDRITEIRNAMNGIKQS